MHNPTAAAGVRINVRDDYRAFLRAKVIPGVRFEGDEAVIPSWDVSSGEIASALEVDAPHLHPYQRFAVTFAIARRRAALFKECGLGKSSDLLAWMQAVRQGPGLVCGPSTALYEIMEERNKFFPALPLRVLDTSELDAWLENPEDEVVMVTHHAFTRDRDLSHVSAIALDESSILKDEDGAISQALCRSARPVPCRLALTATPAPNDPTEYAMHAVFLGYMRTPAEFKARFFVRDGKDWRIKGHAREALPRWLARFALWMRDPSVYGMPCAALPVGEPEFRVIELPASAHGVDVDLDLFGAPARSLTLSERSQIRNGAFDHDARTQAVIDLTEGLPCVVWTIRNAHADALEKALRAAGRRVAQISGATPDDERVRILRAFQAGELDDIVTKYKVIGHGANLPRVQRMIVAGFDESYEALHQMARRGWRQGRVGPMDVCLLAGPEDTATVNTLFVKAAQWKEDSSRLEREFAAALAADLHAYARGETMTVTDEESERLPDVQTDHYHVRHGDSIIEMMENLEPESWDLSVFSPPFASLFTYSSEAADMGNCSDQDTVEFNIHFHHFCKALLRVMKPGRVVCLHLAQIIAFRARHGRKGLRDFRGDVIRAMEDAGFYYYGEWVISKNPQAVAIRTKSERLQFSQFKRDSLESSPALNDYVLEFRKPGKQAVPVKNDISNDEWIAWASGVWTDISETDVLSYQKARGEKDEKHIAPLQLTTIRRCIRLYSNPGEVVGTPFLGIGSEVYEAVCQGRFGQGIELKAEYYRQAVVNANLAVALTYHQTRMDLPEAVEAA